MARKKSRVSAVRRLHRSLGVSAAVFILFMVMSGVAINHSHDLGLDQRHVSQSSLLNWYGFGEPEDIRSFAVADGWLSFAGSQLYLNDDHVATISNGVGAVSNADMLVAAGSEELLLLNFDGSLIERLPWEARDAGPIQAIGLHETTTVAVISANGMWLADEQLLGWQQAGDISKVTAWATEVTPSQGLRKAITSQYRGEGLSLERLLLDAHSGRFFGPVGVIVYDLLAIAVGLMAISGLVLWLRGRRNGNGNVNGNGNGSGKKRRPGS